MRRSVLRVACALADEAERRIRVAGRVLPDHAEVLAALMPAAVVQARMARQYRRAATACAVAAEQAEAAARSAGQAAADLAAAWCAANPGPRLAEFDPARFRVELVSQDHVAQVTSAGGARCDRAEGSPYG